MAMLPSSAVCPMTGESANSQLLAAASRRAAVSTAVSCPNQRNREIATVLHMSVRAPVCEKWRSDRRFPGSEEARWSRMPQT